MTIELNITLTLLILATVAAVSLALVALRRDNGKKGRWIAATSAALMVWIVAYAMEIAATGRESMLFWANLQFLGIGAAPILWYSTVRLLIGRKPLGAGSTALIALIPAATVILAFTDPWHGLFRGNPESVETAGMTLLTADYGLWHNVVFISYQYLLYGAALVSILREWSRASRRFRGRYSGLALAMAFPMVGGALYAAGLPPFESLNPTPLLLLFSFLLALRLRRRHHILDVLPIARDQVFDMLSEALIVLDVEGRVLDLNPSALRLFPQLSGDFRRPLLADAMAEVPELQLVARGMVDGDTAFSMKVGSWQKYFLARGDDIRGMDGTGLGRVISVTDITSQVELLQRDVAVQEAPIG